VFAELGHDFRCPLIHGSRNQLLIFHFSHVNLGEKRLFLNLIWHQCLMIDSLRRGLAMELGSQLGSDQAYVLIKYLAEKILFDI
jgi:hypothetical protein